MILFLNHELDEDEFVLEKAKAVNLENCLRRVPPPGPGFLYGLGLANELDGGRGARNSSWRSVVVPVPSRVDVDGFICSGEGWL